MKPVSNWSLEQFGGTTDYLDVIVAVVVEVENTEEFRIGRDVNVFGVEEALTE